MEEVPIANKNTAEEIACEKHYQETTIVQNNRFVVGMPFKSDATPLGDTFVQAKRRFHYLEKRLEANPALKKSYSDFIHEFQDLNHLEAVPNEELVKKDSDVNFLPHHCVHKEDSTTTKLRVVFDGSAKSSTGVSLNGSLMVGPTVQEDLFSILIRFRLHRVALSADIAKMYQQIALESVAKDFHRILWQDSITDSIQQYRMTRVTYGIASSAFHSTRSVIEVGNRCSDDLLAKTIKHDFYVDDYLSGANSVEEAKIKVTKIYEKLKEYGFELRKWSSSHHEITSSLPENLRENPDKEKFMDENYKIKTLGVSWKPNSDSFHFYSSVCSNDKITKRKLLSETVKLFDPVGWLAPVVIKFKVILQKLWIQGVGWDDVHPTELQNEWIEIQSDLNNLISLQLPRCIVPTEKSDKVQLHLFTDASEVAFAAVIYIRITDSSGKIFTNLVSCKTRVAPIKTISVPRLELCGAHLGIKLLTKIEDILELSTLPQPEIYGWTDSTIVLQWLAQLPRTWTSFVANRISEIQQILPRANWNHVKSNSNPADCASRGTLVKDLIDTSLWWHGPGWLSQPESTWPQPFSTVNEENKQQIESEKKHKRCETVASAVIAPQPWIDISHYSSLSKLQRIIATIIKASHLFKDASKEVSVTPQLLNQAKLILRQHQAQYYATDLAILTTGKELPRNSKILNLSFFRRRHWNHTGWRSFSTKSDTSRSEVSLSCPF